ncbi:hypothetical protein FKM82_024623 [Ascaphus truei]
MVSLRNAVNFPNTIVWFILLLTAFMTRAGCFKEKALQHLAAGSMWVTSLCSILLMLGRRLLNSKAMTGSGLSGWLAGAANGLM